MHPSKGPLCWWVENPILIMLKRILLSSKNSISKPRWGHNPYTWNPKVETQSSWGDGHHSQPPLINLCPDFKGFNGVNVEAIEFFLIENRLYRNCSLGAKTTIFKFQCNFVLLVICLWLQHLTIIASFWHTHKSMPVLTWGSGHYSKGPSTNTRTRFPSPQWGYCWCPEQNFHQKKISTIVSLPWIQVQEYAFISPLLFLLLVYGFDTIGKNRIKMVPQNLDFVFLVPKLYFLELWDTFLLKMPCLWLLRTMIKWKKTVLMEQSCMQHKCGEDWGHSLVVWSMSKSPISSLIKSWTRATPLIKDQQSTDITINNHWSWITNPQQQQQQQQEVHSKQHIWSIWCISLKWLAPL